MKDATSTSGAAQSWGEANRAAGADPDAVARGVANTNTFYAPEPDPANV